MRSRRIPGSGCEVNFGIITRHPMREDELKRALKKWTPGRVDSALKELAVSGWAQVVERYGYRFWSASPARYPEKTSVKRKAPQNGEDS